MKFQLDRVHKKCSGLKRLKKDPDYSCTWCQGTACPLDGRPQKEVQVGPDKFEVVASFCYLGEMLSAAGGCELSTTTRVKPPGRSSRICYQTSRASVKRTYDVYYALRLPPDVQIELQRRTTDFPNFFCPSEIDIREVQKLSKGPPTFNQLYDVCPTYLTYSLKLYEVIIIF